MSVSLSRHPTLPISVKLSDILINVLSIQIHEVSRKETAHFTRAALHYGKLFFYEPLIDFFLARCPRTRCSPVVRATTENVAL